MSKANFFQVGGTHYKTEYEHWDFVADLGLGPMDYQITKYLIRAKSKNGIQDIQKALHFAKKNAELISSKRVPPQALPLAGLMPRQVFDTLRFCTVNKADEKLCDLIFKVVLRHGHIDATDIVNGIKSYLDELVEASTMEVKVAPEEKPSPAEITPDVYDANITDNSGYSRRRKNAPFRKVKQGEDGRFYPPESTEDPPESTEDPPESTEDPPSLDGSERAPGAT